MTVTMDPTPPTAHDPRAHQLELLRVSGEQVKCRAAVDIIRLIDVGDGPDEVRLRELAVDWLTEYFTRS